MDSVKSNKVFIVDGSSYVMRAFHAIFEMTSPTGIPTNATLGVTNMILKLIKENPGDNIIFTMDPGGKTIRHDIYSEYKAGRKPMPDQLKQQIPYIKAIIEALGIPLVVIPGIEADDTIGTISKKLEDEGYQAAISSGDKDILQLVTEKVSVFDTMKDATYDVAGVKAKLGVEPQKVADLLAIMGDKSDNIPGVSGIGIKTAISILEHFGTIDNIKKATEEEFVATGIRGAKGVMKKIRNAEEDLEISRKLTRIFTDLDIPDIQVTAPTPDMAELSDICTSLGLKKALKMIEKIFGQDSDSRHADNSPAPKLLSQTDTPVLPVSQESIDAYFSKSMESHKVAANKFDIDLFLSDVMKKDSTTYLHLEASEHGCPSLALRNVNDTLIIHVEPVVKSSATDPAQQGMLFGDEPSVAPDGANGVSMAEFKAALTPWLKSVAHKKVLFNSKVAFKVFHTLNLDFFGVVADPMFSAYTDGFYGAKCKNLDDVFRHYFGANIINNESTKKEVKWDTQKDLDAFMVKQVAAIDFIHTFFDSRTNNTSDWVKNIEIPAAYAIAVMESNGITLNKELIQLQDEELGVELKIIEDRVKSYANSDLNLASPKQVAVLLFDTLGLPNPNKSKTSTADDVLSKLKDMHPSVELIQRHRSLSKLKDSYTSKLPTMVDNNGRIHTSYNQALTSTGRLSSMDPNLQNIPVRTNEGKRIRQAFIAKEGFSIVSLDYSQIELRIVAHLSDEPALIEAFNNNVDIHKVTASEVFSVPLENVSSELRRRAKAINFGLIYGLSARSLAEDLDIPQTEAADYMNKYFGRFPKVIELLKQIKEFAIANGYVQTILNRRIFIKNIDSGVRAIHNASLRSAINAPMQGSAADIIKIAMSRAQNYIESASAPAAMLMQVHDELVFEVETCHAEFFAREIQCAMESAMTLKVPLQVDFGIGQNYLEAH